MKKYTAMALSLPLICGRLMTLIRMLNTKMIHCPAFKKAERMRASEAKFNINCG